jgi:hypothetical protein
MRCLVLLVLSATAWADDRIGGIEFFGYKGIDVEAVRKALPVHVGDAASKDAKSRIRKAVPTTNVESVCCDENGRSWFFIGLTGSSVVSFAYLPRPTGAAQVSPELAGISKNRDEAQRAAVQKGGDAAQEDDSAGYAISKDPEARAWDLKLRAYAIAHEAELLNVLATSADEKQRSIAAEALGYAEYSLKQVSALLRACRDPNDGVRNNASRALGVLAASNQERARAIEPDVFVEMIRSGVWTDRNKASFVLMELTALRDPSLLAKLRAQSKDALLEMAGWRDTGHAMQARIILGRMAGIAEDQLLPVTAGTPEAFLEKLASAEKGSR